MTHRCPKCEIKIIFGYPYPGHELMPRVRRDESRGLLMIDDAVLGSDIILEKNYCPACGALVFEGKPLNE